MPTHSHFSFSSFSSFPVHAITPICMPLSVDTLRLGYLPAPVVSSMPKKKTDHTWMKNHALEGDDVVTGFYNILAKRNPKTMKPCHGIRVPDTVVFEHNFPRGWYTTDTKANEVIRKQGKELDASQIEHGFKQSVSDSCPIVATYLCTTETEVENGQTETTTLVEVFNKANLAEFLARKTKKEGILQKFIMPKGYQNSVIMTVWSPRLCMVQRRTNKYRIFDRKRAEQDPFSTTVTYDGPTFLSDGGTVSGNVAIAVKELCGNIVQHFFYTEHKYITRMVLYFKADQRDRLWFLWCGSLRVSDRDTPSEMPVNLVTNFAEPDDGDTFDEDQVLISADEAYMRITNDEMFYETFMKHSKSHGRIVAADSERKEQQAARSYGSDAVDQSADTVEKDNFDWTNASALVIEMRERLEMEEDAVLSTFEDIFYKARNHFLTIKESPYVFSIPQKTVDVLTENGVVDLMRILQIPSTPGSTESSSLCYTLDIISPHPLTQLSDKAREWITAYFETKMQRLKGSTRGLGNELDSFQQPADTEL